MPKLPHVCLFTDSLEPSGVGEHMLTLAAEFAERYRLSLVCPPSPGGDALLDRAAAMGIETLPWAINRPYLRPGFAHWLCQQEVAVFHGHAGIGWEGHDGVYAARMAEVPALVRTEHLPYLITDPQQRQEHCYLLDAVDRLIVVSEGVCRTFRAAGVPPTKLRTVQNGIHLRPAEETGTDIREELGLPAQAKIALTIGRFSEQKGHSYLADALPIVHESVPDVHLLWVGSGPLEESLRDQVARLGLTDQIHFLGKRKDVPELLAQCDLFVLPSLFEGLPLIVLEAMAASRPVVATDVCGSSEAVRDGETGRLVPARDPAALAEAIVEALTQPFRASAWGAMGRKRYEKQFTAARMAAETADVYDRLLSQARERVAA